MASMTELMMFLMIFVRKWTGALGVGVFFGVVSRLSALTVRCWDVLLRKKNSPALLWDLGLERYKATLTTHMCMSLAV